MNVIIYVKHSESHTQLSHLMKLDEIHDDVILKNA